MNEEINKEMLDPQNWKPNYSVIAKKVNMTRSAVTEYINRRRDKKLIEVQIVENTESEAALKAKQEKETRG